MVHKNYYFILGVPRTESASGLRQAFRALVKRYHPERMGLRGLRFFQEILEAYHVLSDPLRRQSYDRGLAHAEGVISLSPDRQYVQPEAQPALPRIVEPPLRQTVAVQTAFVAALARIARQLTSDMELPERWEGLDVHVMLSPVEAARGGMLFLTVPSCVPCQACGGSGRDELFPCAACQGEGFLAETDTVRIPIPPQIGDGTRLEVPLPGLGVHGFYLRLHVRVTS